MTLNEINVLDSYLPGKVEYRFYLHIDSDNTPRIFVRDSELAKFIDTFGLSDINRVLTDINYEEATLIYCIYLDELYRS